MKDAIVATPPATNITKETRIAIRVIANKKRRLYILFCNEVIAAAALVQVGRMSNFITCLDTTGYGRGYTGVFASAILKSLSGLVVCFSHPKKELIFQRSSENPEKRILGPRDLFQFWRRVFEARCENSECSEFNSFSKHKINDNMGDGLNVLQKCTCSTWSNFEQRGAIPYRKLTEIERFNDDPKAKLMMSSSKPGFKTVKNLFEALLVRRDFGGGGLLFSCCYRRLKGEDSFGNEHHSALEAEQFILAKIMVDVGTKKPGDIKNAVIDVVNNRPGGCLSKDNLRVSKCIKMLRKLDFSTIDLAISSSKKFVQKNSLSLLSVPIARPCKVRKTPESSTSIISNVRKLI